MYSEVVEVNRETIADGDFLNEITPNANLIRLADATPRAPFAGEKDAPEPDEDPEIEP
jgi:hypothetical protein